MTTIFPLLDSGPIGNPAGGGYFYSKSGELHWVGSSGSDTRIATSGLSSRPLQVNVDGFNYYDTSQPFLNLVKAGNANGLEGWCWNTVNAGGSPTNEELYLSAIFDNNKYPTSLTCPGIPGGQLFTKLRAWVNFHFPAVPPGATYVYPPGAYRFKFIGQGQFIFSGDVASLSSPTGGATIAGLTVTNASASTYVTVLVNVATPSAGGIVFDLISVNSGTDYPRDISLVQNAYVTNYDGGQIFHPTWLAAQAAAGTTVLRFLGPLMTNDQVSQHYGPTFLQLTVNPATNDTTAVLVTAWPRASGTYLITLQNGQDFQATFGAGSTAVALNGTVSSNCIDRYFHLHRINGWADRPKLSEVCWAAAKGAPYEVCLQMCNATNKDAWITVPPSFNSSDWASLCSLVLSTLNSGLKCYVEWSNEVWDAIYDAFQYAYDKSVALFGSANAAAYYGSRVALMADQFATTAGNPIFDNRFIIVMSGQAGNTAVAVNSLAATSWVGLGNTAPWQRTSASGAKTIKCVAIAPYFGGNIPADDFAHLTGLSDGGYTDFFAMWNANPVNGYTFVQDDADVYPYHAGGAIGDAISTITAHVTALAAYGALPIVCYEGGWGFTANAGQQTFLTTASRDARIAPLVKQYLLGCLQAGAALPSNLGFCSDNTGVFEWGMLESIMQPVSPLSLAPPRFRGMTNYTAGQ